VLTHFQQYAEPSLASNLATAQLESVISVRVGYSASTLAGRDPSRLPSPARCAGLLAALPGTSRDPLTEGFRSAGAKDNQTGLLITEMLTRGLVARAPGRSARHLTAVVQYAAISL